MDFNLKIIKAFVDYLKKDIKILRASDISHNGNNTERLVQLVQAVDGDTHLTSTFGTDREYIDWSQLSSVGISIQSQKFTHPIYPQLYGDFVKHISTLDMLFNCGTATKEILEKNRIIEKIVEH